MSEEEKKAINFYDFNVLKIQNHITKNILQSTDPDEIYSLVDSYVKITDYLFVKKEGG